MKIVFLDIDGVLNSDKYLEARSDKCDDPKYRQGSVWLNII